MLICTVNVCVNGWSVYVYSNCCHAVATNAAGGDQQFLQISFTPAATAAFPAVSQPAMLVAPAVGTGTQHLPVLAPASQAVMPGSPAWMQVTSLPPVIVKQEKCAITFSAPSTISDLSNNRCVIFGLSWHYNACTFAYFACTGVGTSA